MKQTLSLLAFLLAPGIALAAGTHAGGHGHDDGHGMMMGEAAHHAPSRTVKVIMREDQNGENYYVFDQKELRFAAGETVRLHIVNEGEEVHEFVMDTKEANEKHKALMAKFPEMEHDDPNSIRLEPGQEGEILWTFGKPGTFEFACLLPGHYEGGMHGNLIIE